MSPIPLSAKRDAEWWKRFKYEWNGVSLILEKDWSNPDEIIATDTSPRAGGAYTNDYYFSEEFPPHLLELPIHIKEDFNSL